MQEFIEAKQLECEQLCGVPYTGKITKYSQNQLDKVRVVRQFLVSFLI
jgi:hypothetical protein